jgi:hypothetical protein
MAWDLTRWRSLFEMLAIGASFVGATPFPIPHFLSFDRQFVKLTETFQLSGLIYAADGRRCEHIYSEARRRRSPVVYQRSHSRSATSQPE